MSRLRHALALEAVQRVALVGRAQALRVFDAGNVALAAAVTELQDVAAVVLVHGVAERAPEGDRLVAIDGRVVREDAAAQR